MKSLLLAALTFTLALNLQARKMRAWFCQELYDQADLVAIGRAISTTETKEKAALRDVIPNPEIIGLSTEFEILLVMKGDKEVKKVILHHYRLNDADQSGDGIPFLAKFDPKQNASFLLFLKREKDGRYAPVSGQTDPALFSILKTEGAAR